MNKKNLFWSSLEVLLHGGTRRAVWKQVWESDFDAFSSYLRPVDGLADRVGCERTLLGSECGYRIIEREKEHFVGVCDEGRCPSRNFPREELALFAIDHERITQELVRIFELIPGIRPIEGTGRVTHLGRLRGEPAVDVLFVRQRKPEDLRQFLENYFSIQSVATLFVIPTNRRVDESVLQILNAHKSGYFTLEGAIGIQKEKLGYLANGRQLWLDSLSSCGNLGVVSSGFSLPALTRWEDLTLKFKDGHTLSVRHGRTSKLFSFTEMGMVDARTKAPDEQWRLLRLFADEMGIFTWKSKGVTVLNRKRKERLAKKLKSYFGISSDPFTYRKEDGGWEAVFTILKD